MNEQERTKNAKEFSKEQESSIDHLKGEILTKESKEKELQNMVKAKTEAEYSLKKAIK